MSAAFDMVNHGILLERLQSEFGVRETPLAWLQSYLEGRTQFVKLFTASTRPSTKTLSARS